MDNETIHIILRTISAVAWADGKLTEGEKKHLIDTCANIGDVSEKEVESILSKKEEIDTILPDIKNLPIVIVGELLNFCYRNAMTNGRVNIDEARVMKKIAMQFWPEHKANLALKWVKRVYDAEQYYMELFLLPQVKEQG